MGRWRGSAADWPVCDVEVSPRGASDHYWHTITTRDSHGHDHFDHKGRTDPAVDCRVPSTEWVQEQRLRAQQHQGDDHPGVSAGGSTSTVEKASWVVKRLRFGTLVCWDSIDWHPPDLDRINNASREVRQILTAFELVALSMTR